MNGTEVRIEFYFILVLAVAAMMQSKDFLYILLFSALHELGHLILLYICGGKAQKLTFSYYGFALKYNNLISQRKEVLVLLAGPLVNLILYLFLRDDYNLILFFINILPVYPLDGGRIIKLIFHRASKAISIFILLLIYALSVYLIITYKSFSMLLIALYLTMYSLNY